MVDNIVSFCLSSPLALNQLCCDYITYLVKRTVRWNSLPLWESWNLNQIYIGGGVLLPVRSQWPLTTRTLSTLYLTISLSKRLTQKSKRQKLMESWKNISIKVQIYNFPSTGNTRMESIDDLGSKSYLALYVYVITDIEEDLKIPKGLIKSRKSKKVRQHNDQKKKNKRTNNDAQKTKDRATGTPLTGHFILHLTFPISYIFWNVHDSSTFCQNFRAYLKSCSEMPGYGKHLHFVL